nr:DNA-directed RNA polymerase III subunit RPC3-like [Anolis sagrei ordinatus]
MTQAQIQLCSLLLREHFGEIVGAIGTQLIRRGGQPLGVLAHQARRPLHQVRKALCVLIHHGLVSFHAPRRRGAAVEYEAHCGRVLRLLRFPRYIYMAKTLYGDAGELLVEELLLNGQMPRSALVRKVADRLTDTMEEGKTMDDGEVSATFVRLADTRFVQRCPSTPSESQGSASSDASTFLETDTHAPQKTNLAGKGKRRHSDGEAGEEEEEGERKAKQPKQEASAKETPAPAPEEVIYWQVNLDRFHQHFRDQAIVSAVANRMDQTSSEIVRTMLRMSEVTTAPGAPYTQPLSSNESVANLMERRLHETKENRRLLEKSQRVEAILASLQSSGGAEEAQLQEIEEMITAPERQQLEDLKRNVHKIDASENQVDETIFILESYINSTVKP